MRMEQIKQLSEQLDSNPNFQFENFEDMCDVIGYRTAGYFILVERRKKERALPKERFVEKPSLTKVFDRNTGKLKRIEKATVHRQEW